MTARERRRDVLAWGIALAPLLFVIAPIRHLVESRMHLHMLLQFPMLIASGWGFAEMRGVTRGRLLIGLGTLDAQGLLGISLGSCVLALWMLPTVLDLALLSDPVRWAKYASLWATGFVLHRSRRRMSTELQLLFVGSVVWMVATVGLIYQTMSQRLCVSYLLEEQRWTGVGLVAIASTLGAAALFRIVAATAGRPGAARRL